jgi:hypothetical protein
MTAAFCIALEIAVLTALLAIGGCSTAPPPEPAPPPAPAADYAPDVSNVPPAEWNVFPNFVTGKIDIYHNGAYYGTIDGDETSDPPVPHKEKGEANQ